MEPATAAASDKSSAANVSQAVEAAFGWTSSACAASAPLDRARSNKLATPRLAA
jgi:hypothetical protein